MVGRRGACLVTGWVRKIDWVWCDPRVLRCRSPDGGGSLVSPSVNRLPLAGTLVPVALVAQGIEHRFPNELLRSRPQACGLRFLVSRRRFRGRKRGFVCSSAEDQQEAPRRSGSGPTCTSGALKLTPAVARESREYGHLRVINSNAFRGPVSRVERVQLQDPSRGRASDKCPGHRG
jgi:hypothetical protein